MDEKDQQNIFDYLSQTELRNATMLRNASYGTAQVKKLEETAKIFSDNASLDAFGNRMEIRSNRIN